MSGNHNQSLERALEIVDAAAATGAQALRLKTYTVYTITMKGAYTIDDKNSLWAEQGDVCFQLHLMKHQLTFRKHS